MPATASHWEVGVLTSSRPSSLAALNAQLEQASLRGQWSRQDEGFGDPTPFGPPHVWKWAAIRDGLEAAREWVPLGDMGARRTIGLVHPKLAPQGGHSSPTLHMSVQLVQPGEVALPHRHTASAIRFILEGRASAYTVVDGNKCTMERGDLILTPNGAWHSHHNETDAPVIWVDGLDVPLTVALHSFFFEPYPSRDGQVMSSAVDYSVRKPAGLGPPGQSAPSLVYKWRDTLPALREMDRADQSPFEGRCLEYRNPAFGGHTLRTLTCWVQWLDPGEATAPHRHTYTHIYHAFEGRGVTEIEGQQYAWEQGDCLIVPNWSWHRHRNTDPAQPAILFSLNDLPLLEALDLYREEA
jgi:gentisate 1,2-dioxygenase